MKSVLISIRPKWCEKIVNGKKTIEVRKSAPKEVPFKCYIYMTQGAYKDLDLYSEGIYQNRMKVIGEFICDKVSMEFVGYRNHEPCYWNLLDGSCLTKDELMNYGEWATLFGWHISDLKIYDKPKELSEFYKLFKYDGDGIICGTREEMNDIYEFDCETVFGKIYPDFSLKDFDCKHCPKARDFYRLTRPPQSWQYIEEVEE